MTTPDAILQALAHEEDGFPYEAVEAAREQKEAMIPCLIAVIADYKQQGEKAVFTPSPLFLGTHLLAEWRAKEAYRPIGAMLRWHEDDLDAQFSDAVAETLPRVAASVYDGDPQPLLETVFDPKASPWGRSAALQALAILTHLGQIERAAMRAILQDVYDRAEPRGEENFLWWTWADLIAALGFDELRGILKTACAQEIVDPSFSDYEFLESDLNATLEGKRTPEGPEWTLWDNTGAELKDWVCYNPGRDEDELPEDLGDFGDLEDFDEDALGDTLPDINPFRDTGRNDPCPCGSGKKYKKCCLGKKG